jgi:hypothetical protein
VELIINIQEPDAKGWLADVFSCVSQEELTMTVVTPWAVWHARRKALHEDRFQSPLSTFAFINQFVADLEAARPPPKQKKVGVQGGAKWLPPPVGIAKLNVDAPLSKNENKATAAQ